MNTAIWIVVSKFSGVVLCSEKQKMTRAQALNVVENHARSGYQTEAIRYKAPRRKLKWVEEFCEDDGTRSGIAPNHASVSATSAERQVMPT